MPGTMGLGVGSFVAVWALMMAAMMLPSVAPFASLYTRTFRERRAVRLTVFVVGYLLVWAAAAFPVYGLAWMADRFVDDPAIRCSAGRCAATGTLRSRPTSTTAPTAEQHTVRAE